MGMGKYLNIFFLILLYLKCVNKDSDQPVQKRFNQLKHYVTNMFVFSEGSKIIEMKDQKRMKHQRMTTKLRRNQ